MNASRELEAFAFLIGKWEGVGKTRLPDGKVVEYPITWIGRYILDGTAIADERPRIVAAALVENQGGPADTPSRGRLRTDPSTVTVR